MKPLYLAIGVIAILVIAGVALLLVPGNKKPPTKPPQEPFVFSNNCEELELQVKELIDQANYCEEAIDCEIDTSIICPFGCYYFYNKDANTALIEEGIGKYVTNCPMCVYGCMEAPDLKDVRCFEGKCVFNQIIEGYMNASINELINDIEYFDERPVKIKGKYVDMMFRARPACEPIGTGLNPVIGDCYATYRSTWGIRNDDGEIAVVVVLENGSQTSNLPNYENGQEIELKGIARSAIVLDYCELDKGCKSIYLEVKTEDIDISLVLIQTDKTDYFLGESMEIILKNSLRKSIWYNKERDCGTSFWVLQKKEGSEWQDIESLKSGYCLWPAPPAPIELEGNDIMRSNWSMWKEFYLPDFKGERESIEPGTYRFSFDYYPNCSDLNYTYRCDAPVTIYSNEFTVSD